MPVLFPSDRGTGQRLSVLNHGLDAPVLSTDTGYFEVTFPGAGEDIDRLRAP
jgi:hypothetical protein